MADSKKTIKDVVMESINKHVNNRTPIGSAFNDKRIVFGMTQCIVFDPNIFVPDMKRLPSAIYGQLDSSKWDSIPTVDEQSKIISSIILNSNTGIVTVCDTDIRLPFAIKCILYNGRVSNVEFGVKEDGECYAIEYIKFLIKKIQESENGFKQINKSSGRQDKFTFMCIVANMFREAIENSSIIFIQPDARNIKQWFNKMQSIIQNDKSKNNILLIPYSTPKHIVTLIVDKNKFNSENEQEKQNSIMCFDSSRAFTKWYSSTLNNKYFSDELYDCIDNNKRPINDTNIQGSESTCSFYTEAFLKIMDEYIINKEKNNEQCDLEDIKKFVNSEIFINNIKLLKEEYVYQYTDGRSCKCGKSAEVITKETIDKYGDKLIEEKKEDLHKRKIVNSAVIVELENILSPLSETSASEYSDSVSASSSGVSGSNSPSRTSSQQQANYPD